MDLSGIISISGKPGLYRVVAKAQNSIIVEALMDKKRFPAYASDRISALEDISIYTYEDDKPLKEIFEGLIAKMDGKMVPSHKEDLSVLQEALSDVLPDYDEERVYPSDIKKIFQWYNLLHQAGLLASEKEEEESKSKEEVDAPKKEKPAKKKVDGSKSAKKSTEAKSEKPAKKENKSKK